MSGTFIISLDCEGKWGMADILTAEHHRLLTKTNLQDSYEKLLQLFEKYEIPVTFAFVMAFTLSEAEQKSYQDSFLDVNVDGSNWLDNFRKAQNQRNTDGWFCPEAMDMVLAADGHEVACHGFTHLPLHPELVAREDAEFELDMCAEVAKLKGIQLATMVYPRNLIGYTDALADCGYIGYRDLISAGTNRAKALLREVDIFAQAQKRLADQDSVCRIPAGYILNPGIGVRKYVHSSISKCRWDSILNNAVKTNSIAHMWFHPHNIITYPAMLGVLEHVLQRTRELRDSSKLICVTQEQYVREQQYSI